MRSLGILSAEQLNEVVRAMCLWLGIKARSNFAIELTAYGGSRYSMCKRKRSHFVTCFAFVPLFLGCVPLLSKLGVCCKSLV